MNKTDIIDVLNASIRGQTINFQDKIFPLIVEYFEEEFPDKASGFIKLLSHDPQLVNMVFPKFAEYCIYKYNINSVSLNNKILMYYD